MGNICCNNQSTESGSLENAKREILSARDQGSVVRLETETTAASPREPGTTDTLLKSRVKLYRYRDSQWKERGVGWCRLLRDNDRQSISLLMRQEKTKKIVANFKISEQLELKTMAGSKNSWTWYCLDYSENEDGEKEMLAMRFKN